MGRGKDSYSFVKVIGVFVLIVAVNSVLFAAGAAGGKKEMGARIDLAKEAKLTASHTTAGGDYEIEHAVDGNPATAWVGKGQPLTWQPSNVIVEFAEPKTVQRVVLTSMKLRNLLAMKDLEIYAWAQNTWAGKTPLAVVKGIKELTTVIDFEPVKTKSLRIRIRDTHYYHSFPRIVEMEIYEALPGAKLKKLKDAPIADETRSERHLLDLAFGIVPVYPRTKFDPAKGYFYYAKSFADTMIAEGTDRYGKVHSPMFTSLMDMETHRNPLDTPGNSPGQRYGDRSIHGGNLFHDVMLLRALDYMSELTGNDKYCKAVTEYLKFFLANCPRPETGLFPWGEHAYWNFYDEKPGADKHEYLGGVPNSFWERMWQINPKAVRGEADGLLNHVTNLKNFHFDRHADINKPLPDPRPERYGGMDFPRHGGFYIGLWTFVYSKTGETKYLDWSKKMIGHHWRMRNKESGLPPGKSGSKEAAVTTTLALALNLLEAAQLLKEGDARARYEKVAKTYLDSILRVQHKPAEGKFLVSFPLGSSPETAEGSYGDPYAYGYGGGFSADYANLLVAVYRQTGDKRALELAEGFADYYAAHDPPPITECVYARVYASIVGLFVDLYEISRKDKYLVQAKRYAKYGIENLYHKGLFRGATNVDHYEAEMMAGNLVYNLTWLHAADRKADVKIEPNYFNR